ncbi:14089_t:CDS:1, partial [Acaulospora morrowiae]
PTLNVQLYDATEVAKSIVQLVKLNQHANVTMQQFVGMMKQESTKRLSDVVQKKQLGFPSDFRSTDLTRDDVDKLFKILVLENYLNEKSVPNYSGFVASYIKV